MSSYKDLDVRYNSGFTDATTGVEHAYLKQYYNGVPIINTAANVAFKGNKIVSFGSSFVDIDACESYLNLISFYPRFSYMNLSEHA